MQKKSRKRAKSDVTIPTFTIKQSEKANITGSIIASSDKDTDARIIRYIHNKLHWLNTESTRIAIIFFVAGVIVPVALQYFSNLDKPNTIDPLTQGIEDLAKTTADKVLRESGLIPTRHGLYPESEIRVVFNDFSGDKVVDEMWADPLAAKHGGYSDAYIKASVIDAPERYLKVLFVRQGYGTNLTIRPMNEKPVNASNFHFMKFRIRSPKLDRIGVRVKMVDKYNIHWGYGSKKDSLYYTKGLSTSSDDWSEEIKIPLNQNSWFHFHYDGYREISPSTTPDLSSICLIMFEVGFEPNSTISELNSFTGFLLNNPKRITLDDQLLFRLNDYLLSYKALDDLLKFGDYSSEFKSKANELKKEYSNHLQSIISSSAFIAKEGEIHISPVMFE